MHDETITRDDLPKLIQLSQSPAPYNTPMSDDNHNPIYGDPFDVLIAHFEANGIRFSSSREKRRAWFTMNSGSALQKCTFGFDRTGDVLQIRIQYPVLAKEKFRPLAMEFMTRANYGLVIGNFEMDLKDGEIRYHTSHLMEEGRLEDETIKRLFSTAMGTADRYFPALMRVLFAGETPEDAVDLAELNKFEPEEEASTPKASGTKGKGHPTKVKKKRSKRDAKPKETAFEGTSGTLPPKAEDHPACDSPTQATPPPIPPAPRSEDQNDSESGGDERKAA